MNPILQEYISRYTSLKPSTFPKFFTQFTLDEYSESLPYLFEIESFCLRVWQAFLLSEKVCIYSDYDTDAMTATGTMYWGLIELGFQKENLSFYAPDRFAEGYGMNTEAVAILAQKNDLIISVDCGINSVLEAEIIHKTKNCELIITDHHHLHGEVPNCVAVINPRLSEYWAENGQKLEERRTKIKKQIKELSKTLQKPEVIQKLADCGQNSSPEKLQNWLAKISKKADLFATDSQKCLTSSTTGVGVAWFSVLWYAYFLQEMEL